MQAEIKESKTLLAVADGLVLKNLNTSALIHKSEKLQFCKRNIILAKIAFWEKVYAGLMGYLMTGQDKECATLNANNEAKAYLLQHDLCHPVFADFFFNFHEVLTKAFMDKIVHELSNGMPFDKKFTYLAAEMTELINVAYLELKGMDFACTTFGGEPVCPDYLSCGKHDCEGCGNLFHFLLTEEYRIDPSIYESILGTVLDYSKKAAHPILLIIDYRNASPDSCRFDKDAYERFVILQGFLPGVYFYNLSDRCIEPKFKETIAPFIIPDREGLEKVKREWKYKQKLVRF